MTVYGRPDCAGTEKRTAPSPLASNVSPLTVAVTLLYLLFTPVGWVTWVPIFVGARCRARPTALFRSRPCRALTARALDIVSRATGRCRAAARERASVPAWTGAG